ncbi:MAG TPA: hypothetical protein VNJ47_00055 [Nevskiales bacterium]|nr:hypothetical protein [Nevskiales bacterium]
MSLAPHIPGSFARSCSLAALALALAGCSGDADRATADGSGGGSGGAVSAHVADGDDRDWQGTSSYVSGRSVYSRGEFIHSDYVHDDSGANIDGLRAPNPDYPNPVTGIYPNPQDPTSPWLGGTGNNFIDRFRHSGDYAYPASGPGGLPLAYPGGYYDVADLLEYRQALDAAGLHVLVRLGAMTAADSSVVGICWDADGNAATGAQSWPRGANLNQALGCDYFATLWGRGGELTDFTRTPAVTQPITVAANTEARPPFIEADIPLPASAPRGVWRTYVGAGLWDAAAQAWRPAVNLNQLLAPGNVLGTAPNLYDLLFQPEEANDYWRDTRQADALVKPDIRAFHADIDLDILASGGSTEAPRPTGLLNIQYPALALGDGQGAMTNWSGGLGTFVYKGPVQPYALVLPSNYYAAPHPRPLVAFFHASNVNHSIWPVGVEGSATPHRNLITDPPLGTTNVRAIVDRNDILVVGTLQRGEKGPAGPDLPWADIGGEGERDLRDVLQTLTGRDGYRVDPDRVIYSGMSYGGQTTQAMMTLYPDELAAAVVYNAPGTGVPARLMNVRNLYHAHVTGDTGLDATAPVFGRQAAEELTRLGYRHLYLEFIGRAHDFNLVYESLPIIEQTAWRAVRDPDPARVSYRLDRAIEATGAALGLAHDRAYWASGLQLADGAATGTLDAIALPLAHKLPRMRSLLTGTFINVITGNSVYVQWQEWDRDLSGRGLADFQPGWLPLPDVRVQNTTLEAPGQTGANAFVLTTDLAAVTLDLARMGLSTRRPGSGEITATQPLRLTLRWPPSDGPPARVALDGRTLDVERLGDAGVLALPAGPHRISFEP